MFRHLCLYYIYLVYYYKYGDDSRAYYIFSELKYHIILIKMLIFYPVLLNKMMMIMMDNRWKSPLIFHINPTKHRKQRTKFSSSWPISQRTGCYWCNHSPSQMPDLFTWPGTSSHIYVALLFMQHDIKAFSVPCTKTDFSFTRISKIFRCSCMWVYIV